MKELATDLVVGRMKDATLQTQVSVRGGNIVIGYQNTATMRGFEVGYSPQAIQQFREILAAAYSVAIGKGLG